MEREAILDGIGRRTDFDSRWRVERAALSTLRTLGECISAGQAGTLAARLPPEFVDTLTERSGKSSRSFSADEFVLRVAQREGRGVSTADALVHVRATTATLADLSLRTELRNVREQLPAEFATLFATDGLPTE